MLVPAIRNKPNDQYGHTGHYYFWPDLYKTFKSDMPVKFRPEEKAVEFTLTQWIDFNVTLSQQDMYKPEVFSRHEREYLETEFCYYYHMDTCKVFKSSYPFGEGANCIPLYVNEYIALSVLFNQNQEDTLL